MFSLLFEIGRNGEVDQAVNVLFGIRIVGNFAAVNLQSEIQHDVQDVVEKHPDVCLFAESVLKTGKQGSKKLAVANVGILAEIGRIKIPDICDALFAIFQNEMPYGIEICAATGAVFHRLVVHDLYVGHGHLKELCVQRFEYGSKKVFLIGKNAVDISLVEVGATDDRLGGSVLKSFGCDDFDGIFDQSVTHVKMLQNKTLPLLKKIESAHGFTACIAG